MEGKTELQRNAFARARRQELETYQRALDIQWLDSRMEDGGMGRCLALIKREAEQEKDFQERTDHAAIVNSRAKKEIALGFEIAQVRREEVCQLLRRHYLRQKDPSLRELAKKLQAGYVCRDLQQQMLHNQYRKLQEKAEDKVANGYILDSIYDAKEKDEKEKNERTIQYCKELQQQLVTRQLQKQCEYEETLIEKKMLEEIMRTLSDEDQRELQQKKYLKEKTRNEMVTFQKAREAWREKQKQMVIAEEKQLEEQRKKMSDKSTAVIAERERKLKRKLKEEINARMTAKQLADEAARQERENIIKLLQEQELLEKNVQDDIAEKEKSERVKKETKEALTNQMETNKRLERERKERETQFRLKTEKKMDDEAAKEREKQLKQREKGKLYTQELLKQIQENERRKKQDAMMEEQRVQYVWDCDKKWRQEVAEERKKMIEEHVPPLLGYLQAGIIQKTDLPAVREGANKREDLAKLDIEGMAISKRPRRFAKCNAQCRILREY